MILFLFIGCEEKPYGNIHYDRDVCEHCKMIISNRNFAVDVFYENKHYYFDDIGCVADWYEKHFDIFSADVYVTDAKSGNWINAKTAFWYRGLITPMGFGYGAFEHEQKGKKNLSFKQVIEGSKKYLRKIREKNE